MTVPPNPYAEYDSEGMPVAKPAKPAQPQTPPPYVPNAVTPGQPVFVPEQVPAAYQVPTPEITSIKSPTLTWVLALILGWIGAHDFYTGNHKIGALKVVLFFALAFMIDTALDPVAQVLVWVLVLWMFLDVGRVFFGQYTDGDGFPVKYGG